MDFRGCDGFQNFSTFLIALSAHLAKANIQKTFLFFLKHKHLIISLLRTIIRCNSTRFVETQNVPLKIMYVHDFNGITWIFAND